MNPGPSQLETLLKLRRAERDQRQAAWAATQQAELGVQTEVARARQSLDDLHAEVRRCTTPGVTDMRQLCDHHDYGRMLRESLKGLQRRQQDLHLELARLHQSLVVADQEVRMLENLQGRRAAQTLTAHLKSETARLDEIARQGLERHQAS